MMSQHTYTHTHNQATNLSKLHLKSDITFQLLFLFPDICSTLQLPEGMQDHKVLETASVDSSKAIEEEDVPCTTPKQEELPEVEKSPSDWLWTNFKEGVPADTPAQPAPLKRFIPEAFDKLFNPVLFSSCEDYQSWVTKAMDTMQYEELLKEKVTVNHNVFFFACLLKEITLCAHTVGCIVE